MLKDKFNKTLDLIEKQQEANQRLEYSNRLKSSLDEMRGKSIELILKLEAYIKMYQLMGVSITGIDKSRILDSISVCLSKDVYSLSDEDIEKFSYESSSFERAINQKWCNYANSVFPKNISSMRTYLPFCPNPDEMNKIIGLLEKYLNNSPENARTVENIYKEVQKGEKIVNDISLTEERRKFLDKIAKGNATLDDLTPEILQWIRDLEFTNRIKLRI